MRLLVVTDFHSRYEKVPEILKKAGKVDGTLLAGDLTEFGPAENAKKLLGLLPKPILAVPGNCDPKEMVQLLKAEGVSLHEGKKKLDNVTFVGIGGSNPTPFGTPIEFSEEELRGALERLMKDVNGPAILVSHAPPKGHQDTIPGGVHVGSEAIAHVAPQFKAVVCGHIHEDRGISKAGDTVIVNPGMAALGNAAILEIDANGRVNARLI
ncbi:MAG TPA: metallophosphoesterase [Methanocella sp.]|nr:metallophosphoesterase [Methanocella sp.]